MSATGTLAERKALFQTIFDHSPDGIAICSREGVVEVNASGAAIMGDTQTDEGMEKWAEQYGLFHPDKKTRFETQALPLVTALVTRKPVHGQRVYMRSASRPEGAWLAIDAFPLPDGGAVAIFRDVTREATVHEHLEARRAALAAAEKENQELIDRLRVALDELSTPVLELWKDVLALPVIGLVDTQRSAQMTERLLGEVASRRARHVIVDLTGVEVLDTSTADRFVALARAVRMLGAQCVITGIQPSVAQTMVTMGVDLEGIVTLRNLAHALAWCMRREASGRFAPELAS
jgi:rsbT co-antagonist protein RsbR